MTYAYALAYISSILAINFHTFIYKDNYRKMTFISDMLTEYSNFLINKNPYNKFFERAANKIFFFYLVKLGLLFPMYENMFTLLNVEMHAENVIFIN